MKPHARRLAVGLMVSAALTAGSLRAQRQEPTQADPGVDVDEGALHGGATAGQLFQNEADGHIAERVREALAGDRELAVRDLQVKVRGGIVTLEGRVDSESGRQLAGGYAGAADGVQGVVNLLQVQPGPQGERGAPPAER